MISNVGGCSFPITNEEVDISIYISGDGHTLMRSGNQIFQIELWGSKLKFSKTTSNTTRTGETFKITAKENKIQVDCDSSQYGAFINLDRNVFKKEILLEEGTMFMFN